MTLYDLADLDADELAKLTPEQLHAICEPFFKVTRPEQVRSLRAAPAISFEMQQKLKMAESLGVDVSFMSKSLKKKPK